MENYAAIILAAGKGTRMKSDLSKVLHEVAGATMLGHVLGALKELKVKSTVVVVGHGSADVRKKFAGSGVKFVEQKEQLGTGHAVKCGLDALKGFKGGLFVLSGDVPLITSSTLKGLKRLHERGVGRGGKGVALTFISAILSDPSGYGRVVRDDRNRVTGVVEQKDCTAAEGLIKEINTGLYLFDSDFLFKNIKKLKTENAQGEYYLPDLLSLAVAKGMAVRALTHTDTHEVMGVNNRVELSMVSAVMRMRILKELMLSGVTVIDPGATYVDFGVKVGKDSVIYPGVHLKGSTVIGRGVVIEECVKIVDSRIGDNTRVKSGTVVEESRIGKGVSLGPSAHLRPGNVLADEVRIGNFVELKKVKMGRGSKAGHLSYLGDAIIGRDVNIGAGAITCNYDGKNKFVTTISDNVFVGSDSQLIAPVKVGRNAYVGSGTTVTKDVPAGALVVARVEQKVKKGWVAKRGLLAGNGKRKKRGR